MSFSKNLVKLRRAKGLSQENLADELDLSRQSISKWELELTKPDLENVVKLSKLFGISVDDLIGNEIIKTEAVSINVKEDSKRIKTLKMARGVIICALILFVIVVVYKFVMLFRITKIGEHYKELNNYHYKIKTFIDINTTTEEECWFKDGVSKTVKVLYKDNKRQEEKVTYLDYNSKNGFLLDNVNSKKIDINVEEYLEFHEGYDKGSQLYKNFPDDMLEGKIFYLINRSLLKIDMRIKQYEGNVFLSSNNSYINFDKDSLLPILNYYKDEDTNSFITKQYEIELDSVDEIKI